MSRYLPLCDYMSQKTGLPQPLVSKFNICGSLVAANTLCYLTAPQFSQTSSLSLAVANLTACGLTASAEGFVPKLLNKQRIGLTKGGMILRSSQIGAFLTPYLLLIGLSLAQPSENKTEAPKPEGPAPTISLEAR